MYKICLPFGNVVCLFRKPQESPLNLYAYIESQQQLQARGFSRQCFSQRQESRQHSARGVSRWMPSVIKVHRVHLIAQEHIPLSKAPLREHIHALAGPPWLCRNDWFHYKYMYLPEYWRWVFKMTYRNTINKGSILRWNR